MSDIRKLSVIDSHTGGEPTRVIIAGAPDLGHGTAEERRDRLRAEHDWVRTASVLEPRGSDAVVGALLMEPEDPASTAAVVFFNNLENFLAAL